MPRPAGSLNRKTLDKMVADGEVCLLSERMNCVRCREVREAEERQRVETAVRTDLAAMPAGLFPPAAVPLKTPGSTQAMLLDTFLEYRAPDGKEWRAERGADLLRDFEILPARVREMIGVWHAALATQERAWLLVRRFYGVAPMLGTDDPDDLRVWTMDEIGRKLGVDTDALHALLSEIRLFWKRHWTASRKERASVGIDPGKPMTQAEVAEMLDRYELTNVIGEVERRYAAKRCRDLAPYLDSETGAPIARSAIQDELNLFYVLDVRIAAHQATVNARNAEALVRGVTGNANEDKDNERLTSLMEARQKAMKAYRETMTALGATQVQTGAVAKKQGFHLCVGSMIEGMQKYYSEADNTIIDGFCTEAEIVIATREKELRPSQYRPDVALIWTEAMDRLWDKDYEPTPVGRMRARKLRKCFRQAVREMLIEEGEADVQEAVREEEQVGDFQSAPAPFTAGPQAETTAASAPAPMRPGRSDDHEVAVF